MRVAPDDLLTCGLRYLFERRLILFFQDEVARQDQEQHIAEFRNDLRLVVVVDGVLQFVGLIKQVAAHVGECLLAIPGTTLVTA